MKFNLGKIVNVPQGSDLWHALRAKRRTASEAPAAAGKSKYQSRNALLDQKATGLVPEVSSHQQRIYDDGHRAEAEARPHAEALINDELFPVVLDDEEGGFLASMDGLTMDRKIGFEHKLLSEGLAKQIDAGELEEHYRLQLDQQFALSGAEKILFVASDGTEENFKYLWVKRDESRFPALLSTWEQFEKDLANHKPAEAEQPKAEGKAPDALPSLVIRASGMVESSNLKEFEAAARATLANIKTDLKTDQDFSNAEKAVKFCKEVETRLKATKDQVIGQMVSVDEVVRLLESLDEEFRQKRLKLDKDVKAQKEQRKAEILRESKAKLSDHIYGINEGIDTSFINVQMPDIQADFAGAMKGKKTISSLQSACDDELARAKIEANEVAEVLFDNLQQLSENASDYLFLFNDAQQIITKPAEDFAAIVKSRIADHKEAEQKRLDAEREKIRQEEEAKAKKAAEPKAQTATHSKVSGQGRENQQECEVPRTVDELMQTTDGDKVTLTHKEYEQLVHNSKMYLALAAAGVDNWEGYDMAMEIMQEAA